MNFPAKQHWRGSDLAHEVELAALFLGDLASRRQKWHVLKSFHASRAYWHDRIVVVLAPSRSSMVLAWAKPILCTARSAVLHFHMIPAGFNEDALNLLPGLNSPQRTRGGFNVIKIAE